MSRVKHTFGNHLIPDKSAHSEVADAFSQWNAAKRLGVKTKGTKARLKAEEDRANRIAAGKAQLAARSATTVKSTASKPAPCSNTERRSLLKHRLRMLRADPTTA